METTKDIEDQKMLEKSAAYRILMDQWAMKDHLEMVAAIKKEAIDSLYQMDDSNASEAKFGEIRGILKTVARIERELDYILNFKGGT